MTGGSWKAEGIRRMQDEQRPDLAADRAASRFEREFVPIPQVLNAPPDAKPWQVKLFREARAAYLDIATSGSGGVELRAMPSTDGLRYLRKKTSLIAEDRPSGVIVLTVARTNGGEA